MPRQLGEVVDFLILCQLEDIQVRVFLDGDAAFFLIIEAYLRFVREAADFPLGLQRQARAGEIGYTSVGKP